MLFKYGTIFIEVVFKKNQRNMYLKLVDATHARCTVPWYMNPDDVVVFIRQKSKWLTQKAQQLSQKATVDDNHIDSSQFYYLGKPYAQRVVQSNRTKFELSFDTITLSLTIADETHYQNLVATHAKKVILDLIEKMRSNYDQHIAMYGLQPPVIKCRVLKSAWGNCYPRKNLIQLSTRLIHYPPDVIEAVLAHEYVHLVVPNHSKRFYDILTSWMPDYAVRHNQLKGIDV